MSQETSTQEQTPAVAESLQPGLEAQARGLDAVAKARETLGEVAAGPVLLANGEVSTPRDRAEELRMRQEHGHSYQR